MRHEGVEVAQGHIPTQGFGCDWNSVWFSAPVALGPNTDYSP